jgi:hypothetical protein
MSDRDDDLEIQALQRELDDAFATTRPRRGFEDELWLHIQAKRPVSTRFADAIAGFFHGIREVPAVPAAAVASILVIAIGAGLLLSSTGLGRGGGSSGAPLAMGADGSKRNSGEYVPTFGPLPPPAQDNSAPSMVASPVTYVWAGQLNLSITTAPVFRYQEPTVNAADAFATSLGAALDSRPAGFLGSYRASTYTLTVRGTVQTPPSSPAYFILANSGMPDIDAAGASNQGLADIFLAGHSLIPQWPYTVAVETTGGAVKVVYQRQFEVTGYGAAHLVDSNGVPFGLEVDLSGRKPVLASGLLPVSLETADYKIIGADRAIRLATSGNTSGPSVPTVQLNKAELVYVLVPAGDHSFYEPAFLFTGTLQVNGATTVRRVLVPAVDPSQRQS